MRVAIYARVSTDLQAEKGYSIETQLAACKKQALDMGATMIVEFIDEGYSGEYIDRPAMERLRAAIRAKEFDAIVIYDPDRLARNLMHQLIIVEEIDKSGTELKFVVVNYDQSPDGKFMFGIRGLLAELEKEKIKERTMRGKRGKLQSGKLIFNASPYGYDWDAEKSMYVINEEQAKVVRLIFDFVVNEKVGVRVIAIRLNELAIPTAKNVRWQPGTVYKILKNEIYSGIHYGMKYYHKKTGIEEEVRIKRNEEEWIPVEVPAIITKETWEKSRQQLQENKQRSLRNTKAVYLLQHLLYCSICGRQLSVRYSGVHRKSYYWCRSFFNHFHLKPCGARMIQTDIMEDSIWQTVSDLCKNKKNLHSYLARNSAPATDNIKEATDTLKRLDEQEKKLLKQRETIMRWFHQQMISDSDAEKQLALVKEQLQSVSLARNNAKVILAGSSPRKTADEISNTYKSMITGHLTPELKRDILHELIDKIYVMRTDKGSGKHQLDTTIQFK